MFELAADTPRRLWVGLMGGQNTEDGDYQHVVSVLGDMAESSPATGDPSVFILYLMPGSSRPPAIWRQRFSEAERRGHGKRIAFVIVSDSAALRGIRTAMNWLAPPPKGYETAAVPTMDEATSWSDRKRPGVAAPLRALFRDASIRAKKSGSLPDPKVLRVQ